MDARTLAEQLKEIDAKMTTAPWTVDDLDWKDENDELQLSYFKHDAEGNRTYHRAFSVPEPNTLGNHEEGAYEEHDATGIAQLRNLLPDIISALQSQWIKITDDPQTLPPSTKVDYDTFKESLFKLVLDASREEHVAQCTVPSRKDVKPFWSDRYGNTIRNVEYWREIGPLPVPPENGGRE